jgi:hypothetical protein
MQAFSCKAYYCLLTGATLTIFNKSQHLKINVHWGLKGHMTALLCWQGNGDWISQGGVVDLRRTYVLEIVAIRAGADGAAARQAGV